MIFNYIIFTQKAQPKNANAQRFAARQIDEKCRIPVIFKKRLTLT